MFIRFSILAATTILFAACSNNASTRVSDSEALARLEFLEKLDVKEHPKMRAREEEKYQDSKRRRLDDLEAERINYQNEGIQYQNTRQRTRDMIDDIGRMQMNEAEAINKANENKSKQSDVFIFR